MIELRVPVRYSDFDRYGHLSSSRYIDVLEDAVFSRRVETTELRERLDTLTPHIIHLTYKRPITSVAEIRVQLLVSAEDPSILDFAFVAVADETVHAAGKLRFCPADEIGMAAEIPARTMVADHGVPVAFDHPVYTRFDDMNAHNRLALGRPVDLVLCSRMHFLRIEYLLTISALTSRGIGLFLTECEVRTHFLLDQAEQIRITSWTAEVSNRGSEFIVPFKGVTESDQPCFSGYLVFATVDLTAPTPKRAPIPSWLEAMMFEKSPAQKVG